MRNFWVGHGFLAVTHKVISIRALAPEVTLFNNLDQLFRKLAKCAKEGWLRLNQNGPGAIAKCWLPPNSQDCFFAQSLP